MLRHPKLAATSCKRCQEVLLDDDCDPVTRGGQEMPRPASTPPNCRKCPKIPLSIRNNPNEECGPKQSVELTAKNHMAYMYYQEVKAGAPMADDPMTRKLCSYIRMVEDRVASDKADAVELIPIVLSMLVARGSR